MMAVDDRLATGVGDVVLVGLADNELRLVDMRFLRGLCCRFCPVRYLVGGLVGVDLCIGIHLLFDVGLFSGFRHTGVERFQLKPGFRCGCYLLLRTVLVARIGNGR